MKSQLDLLPHAGWPFARSSRRAFLRTTSGLALTSICGEAIIPARAASPHAAAKPDTGTKAAFGFLDRMMDLHGSDQLHLLQSYVPTPSLNLGDCAFIYDNALALIAY